MKPRQKNEGKKMEVKRLRQENSERLPLIDLVFVFFAFSAVKFHGWRNWRRYVDAGSEFGFRVSFGPRASDFGFI